MLGYDKRGVGASTGDWNAATLDDLADDTVAAFDYLKARPEIDPRQIGLLGISQAGWIMPIAGVRAKDVAFIINISGAGVPVWETTLDQTRNEMTMTGMPTNTVEQIIALLRLQYQVRANRQGLGCLRRCTLCSGGAHGTTARHHSSDARGPVLGFHPTNVLLRSHLHSSSVEDANACNVG